MATRRMENKRVIITGGAKGIGREIVQRFLAAGAFVGIADIQDAEEVARELDPQGHQVTGYTVDVQRDDQVDAAVDQFTRLHGGCDVLVNNAGIATSIPPRSCLEIPFEEWRLVFDVNVIGMFRVCRAVIPFMQNSGGGRIINIGSAAAFKGAPYLIHYVSSKGAVLSMTRSLARELGSSNIQVNSVAPGFTLSEATVENTGQMSRSREFSLQGRAIPRDQYPDDVAGAVLFFASDDAAFITGQTLVVDGGTYLH